MARAEPRSGVGAGVASAHPTLVAQVVLAGWNNFRSMVSGLEVKPVQEPSLEAERKSWG